MKHSSVLLKRLKINLSLIIMTINYRKPPLRQEIHNCVMSQGNLASQTHCPSTCLEESRSSRRPHPNGYYCPTIKKMIGPSPVPTLPNTLLKSSRRPHQYEEEDWPHRPSLPLSFKTTSFSSTSPQ